MNIEVFYYRIFEYVLFGVRDFSLPRYVYLQLILTFNQISLQEPQYFSWHTYVQSVMNCI